MKKIVFSIGLLWIVVFSSFSQYERVQNLIYADSKPYHFGFILGFNTMDFNVTHSGVTDQDGKKWFAEQTSLSPGFTVGIISDLRIFDCLNLRFTPVLLFGDRTLTFISEDKKTRNSTVIRSNLINIPLTLKFRGQRVYNYRPYLIGGVSGTIDLGRQRDNVIMLQQLDYGIEFGAGFDIYLPYFKLAPEFKMFLGLGNIVERDRPEIENIADLKYTNALTKLTSRLFILSFNFE